jgi:hypothetical protein
MDSERLQVLINHLDALFSSSGSRAVNTQTGQGEDEDKDSGIEKESHGYIIRTFKLSTSICPGTQRLGTQHNKKVVVMHLIIR